MRAMTCPFFTCELKSAWSSRMFPDTCEPTCTVITALSVPVVATAATREPRVTGAVRNGDRLPTLWL